MMPLELRLFLVSGVAGSKNLGHKRIVGVKVSVGGFESVRARESAQSVVSKQDTTYVNADSSGGSLSVWI